jgi:hypothetical protein
MSRRRTSAIVVASVAVALLAAWWAQREPGGRLPEIASRGGAVGASEVGDGGDRPEEVAAAEVMRATREVAVAGDGEEAAEEAGDEAEVVGTRARDEEKPPAPRYGRVIDAQTGRSLSQAYLARGDGAWKGEVVPDQAIVRCDGNGCFALSLVAPGAFDRETKVAVATGFERFSVLIAVADGYERHAFDPKQLSDDPGAPTEIALARAASLLARVVDRRGVPQFDVDIDLIARQQNGLWICAATDELGEVRFVGLPPDVAFEVTLRPRRGPRLRPWSDPKPLKLEAGEERKQEWQLGGGATVRGRARDQHGQAVAKRDLVLTQKPGGRGEVSAARVYLDGNETVRLALATVTDDEGRFEFDDVAEGSWWLGPACPVAGPNLRLDRQAVAAVAQRIEISAGAATVDVDLAFHSGLVAGGKIVDTAGQPIRAIVRAHARDAGFEGVVATWSGDDGIFRLGPLEPGTFSFVAENLFGGTNSAPLEVTLDTPRDDLRLELSAGAILVVRCRVDENVVVTITTDGMLSRVHQLRGEMSFELPLPSGPVHVEWQAGARTGTKELVLAQKERVEVVVGE